MKIVVVGAASEISATALKAAAGYSAQSDQVTHVDEPDSLLEHPTLDETVDLIIASNGVDAKKLRVAVEAAGLKTPVFSEQASVLEPNNSLQMGHPVLGTGGLPIGQKLSDVERELILQTLMHCGGNKTWAADILGISIRTLRNKLQQYSAQGLMIPIGARRASSASTTTAH